MKHFKNQTGNTTTTTTTSSGGNSGGSMSPNESIEKGITPTKL